MIFNFGALIPITSQINLAIAAEQERQRQAAAAAEAARRIATAEAAAASGPTPTPTPPPAPAPAPATTPVPSVDVAGIQRQLNAATASAQEAQQIAAGAQSAARLSGDPTALRYATAASVYAAQAQAQLQVARAAAGRNDLQGVTVAAGQIATLAATTRGQADLAVASANTALRSGTADPFASPATAGESLTGEVAASDPGAAGVVSSRSGGGGGGGRPGAPSYVETGDGAESGEVGAVGEPGMADAPSRANRGLFYLGLAATAVYLYTTRAKS